MLGNDSSADSHANSQAAVPLAGFCGLERLLTGPDRTQSTLPGVLRLAVTPPRGTLLEARTRGAVSIAFPPLAVLHLRAFMPSQCSGGAPKTIHGTQPLCRWASGSTHASPRGSGHHMSPSHPSRECAVPRSPPAREGSHRGKQTERETERERDRVEIIRARARDVAARASDRQSDRCDSRSDTGRWRKGQRKEGEGAMNTRKGYERQSNNANTQIRSMQVPVAAARVAAIGWLARGASCVPALSRPSCAETVLRF